MVERGEATVRAVGIIDKLVDGRLRLGLRSPLKAGLPRAWARDNPHWLGIVKASFGSGFGAVICRLK